MLSDDGMKGPGGRFMSTALDDDPRPIDFLRKSEMEQVQDLSTHFPLSKMYLRTMSSIQPREFDRSSARRFFSRTS